jgi:predicted dehydrogenase
MSVIRLGYVGCGFMAQKVHIPNFSSISGCTVAAIAEVRSDIRTSVADRYSIAKRYASHLELVEDKDIDAIAISAGYSLQGQMAIAMLERGKAVFMEKPMATTSENAEKILAAAKRGGGRLMIGYMKRYDGGNLLARDKIREFRQSGQLGALLYVRNHGFCGDWLGGLDTPMDGSTQAQPQAPNIVPAWLPNELQNGYLEYLQQYTHNVNLMRWLLDAGDNVSVKHVDFDKNGISGIVVLDIGGVRAVIESGATGNHGWDEHTQVFFANGWVKTSSPPLLLRNVPAEVEVYRSKPSAELSRPIPSPAYTWCYKNEAEAFIRCVQTGAPFDASAEDTATDVRIFEDVYRTWLKCRQTMKAAK